MKWGILMANQHRLKANNSGLTLIEVLGAIVLVSVVFVLVSGILNQMIHNYDQISGTGAMTSEANDIIRHLMTESHRFTPDVIDVCDETDTCIELRQTTEIVIRESGIIVYEENIINKRIEIKNQNIY